MKYKIVASYETGNSFGSEDTTTDITEHNDLTVAKENLLRIQAHYKLYTGANNERNRITKNELVLTASTESWFVNKPQLFHIKTDQAVDRVKKGKEHEYEHRPDSFYALHCLKLKLDNGEDFQLSAPWCGYFERLNAINIVLCQTDDMSIEF